MSLLPAANGRRAALVTALAGAAALTTAAVTPAAGATARPAAAAAADNRPAMSPVALAADPTGFDYAFYRVADGSVDARSVRDLTWSAARNLGGNIVGAPGAAVARTTVVLAARGTDNALWVRMSHGIWGRWQKVGGVLTSGPAVRGAADGRIDVVVRGSDNAAWVDSLPFGGRWSGWRSLGGRLVAAPAVSLYGTVAVTGTDHGVWTTGLGARNRWTMRGGRTNNGPALAEPPETNGLGIFVRGTDNRLWTATCGGGGCSSWTSLGGILIDGPGAVGIRNATGAGADVAVLGTDNAVWCCVLRRGTTWSAWHRAWSPSGA